MLSGYFNKYFYVWVMGVFSDPLTFDKSDFKEYE